MADPQSKSVPEILQELWDLLTTYARQETIDPIKGLGRFVAFGVAGSVVLGVGLVLLTLAGLRALQTETGSTFTGNLSWAPYGITFVGVSIIAGLAVTRISRKDQGRRS